MAESYTIPSQLDAPVKLVIWTIDEVLVFSVVFLPLAMLADATLLGLCIGAIAFLLWKGVKRDRRLADLMRLVYWYLPPMVQTRVMPASHQRLWIG